MTERQVNFPKYEDHQKAWEELAKGIGALKNEVSEVEEGTVVPNSKPGELIIIGTGIETIGISVGDRKILEAADKVLYCVADPVTIVWLKRLRPDAFDLYVLYGDDKIRYTTYMQMTEAQLYWVRQGLKVVVVFYGHPGVFVLSTHRAIKLARREGHRAVMKAGVCALDTLCADLGVDPSHPGLQTHEATDCLTRRRHIDTTLHVILWQVGLIGELGYRRHGYLNNNFSYFVNWLEDLYGSDYKITHYIGSRYPSIDPLIEVYRLEDLHDPAVQANITGLSTFYIPPRDVVTTDRQTALDLGLLQEHQQLVTPASPLREIGYYRSREMAAFSAFKRFRIPPSYRWQDDTEASNFLIELTFDIELQDLYRRDPQKALEDPRFSGLSDKERALLASRDSGSIQIAAKGAYLRCVENERLIARLLNSRTTCGEVLKRIDSKPRSAAGDEFFDWLEERKIEVDWSHFHRSIDFVYRNNLYPWTGVYTAPEDERLITLVGNKTRRNKSILYVNDKWIRHYQFQNGVLKWNATGDVPFNGFLRFDLEQSSRRRLIGKTWLPGQNPGDAEIFVAAEVDPGRKNLASKLSAFYQRKEIGEVCGRYAVRTNGRFAKDVTYFSLTDHALSIDQQPIAAFEFDGDTLAWSGGAKGCFSGNVTFLMDPIIGSVELYGQTRSNDEPGPLKCYGARLSDTEAEYCGPPISDWAQPHLTRIAESNQERGGLMLWHKWEKSSFTNRALNKFFSSLI